MLSIDTEIQNNLYAFNELKSLAFNESKEEEQLKLIQFASTWAVREHTGKFSDIEIEKALAKIAQKYSIENVKYKDASFLHVMTEAYSIGGHTRIVEKWINSAPKNEQHSLFLIDQKKEVPTWLESSIQTKNGTIYKNNPNGKIIDKSLYLRQIASQYQFIVLHIHMDDIIPMLAFATESFTRPIIFVNHGDHLFWLGISLVDMMYDGSIDGGNFTKAKRAIVDTSVVPVPLDLASENKMDRKTALRELDIVIDNDTKVMLSMASPFKYNYFNTFPFIDMALAILNENDNTIFIVIGADKDKEKAWRDAYESSNQRLIAVGLKSREQVVYYKAISDLYIDSFPFNSYTAFLECASVGVPSLSLKTEFNSLDILSNTPNKCKTPEEVIIKTKLLLEGKESSVYDLSNKILSYHSIGESWSKSKDELINKTPSTHTLHWNFSKKSGIDDYDRMLYSLIPSNKRKMPFSKDVSFKNNLKITSILYRHNKLRGTKLLNYFFKVLKYSLRS